MRKLAVLLLLIATGLAYAYFALSVDNRITADDRNAIASLNLGEVCAAADRSFADELTCLEAIQSSVQAIGGRKCASKKDIIEPKAFLSRNYGCCFDRARFIEKAARFYGFETRHIFIIRPKYALSVTNALPLGQPSHAASEVRTSKGWLGVDSNEDFMLVDAAGNPRTYRSALNDAGMTFPFKPEQFFTKDLDIIYGVYSRHGMFHGVNLPGPEFVFSELEYNFFEL